MPQPQTPVRGLSLDVFLSRGENISNCLTLRIQGYDKDSFPETSLSEPAIDIAFAIQRSLNSLSFPQPVREVWFHNNRTKPNGKDVSLPDELYARVLTHLKETQKNPDDYRIKFQSYVPCVMGN